MKKFPKVWKFSFDKRWKIRFSEPEQDRLDMYSRFDLGLEYSGLIRAQTAEYAHRTRFQAGIYNLTNRNNPWYREWVQTVDNSGFRPELTPTEVDVYDLGFQPSVSFGIYF